MLNIIAHKCAHFVHFCYNPSLLMNECIKSLNILHSRGQRTRLFLDQRTGCCSIGSVPPVCWSLYRHTLSAQSPSCVAHACSVSPNNRRRDQRSPAWRRPRPVDPRPVPVTIDSKFGLKLNVAKLFALWRIALNGACLSWGRTFDSQLTTICADLAMQCFVRTFAPTTDLKRELSVTRISVCTR